MKYAFAGDRQLAVDVLRLLMGQGYPPSLLFVSEKGRASHREELIELSGLEDHYIFEGKAINSQEAVHYMQEGPLHYGISIHYPYIIKKEALNSAILGFINLHPAYLPYNKGWHTPTWAILEKTPAGATLHFMTEELDAGDIIHQEKLEINKDDTAHSLYSKMQKLEFEVFKKALPQLIALKPERKLQNINSGTSHKKKDLFKPEVQQLSLEESYQLDPLVDRLRALTTNDINEAAYFLHKGKRYRVQIKITPDNSD